MSDHKPGFEVPLTGPDPVPGIFGGDADNLPPMTPATTHVLRDDEYPFE